MADPVRDFKEDASGDLAVIGGDFAGVSGIDAVKQGNKIRVRCILGEIELDESLGVDWLGQILVKNPDPIVVRELIREALADTPDVTSVVAADLRRISGRSYSVAYTEETVFSSTPLADTVADISL